MPLRKAVAVCFPAVGDYASITLSNRLLRFYNLTYVKESIPYKQLWNRLQSRVERTRRLY